MMTSGIGNAFFGGSILAGWKQLILIVGYVMCFSLVKKTPDLRRIFMSTIFIQITLVMTSMIAGIAPEVVFYNLFYYSAWVPFFIWAARGGTDYYLKKYGKLTFYLVIACGIGLVIDSKTDIFMFLATRQAELDMDYFSQHTDTVKRSAFIFTTSTLVMPVLGGMVVVGLLRNHTAMRAAISAVVILIGIVTSASANSAVLSAGLLLGMLMQLGMKPIRIVGTALVFSVAIFIVGPMVGDDEFVAKQIGQIAGHQSLADEGNTGRLWHWGKALDDIQEFSIIEHIVGSGLGTSNSNNGNVNVLHTHGESSFFQAYLEGGILGLTLRLLPFFLIATLVKSNSLNNRPYLILGYIFTVFLVDAVAPLFGNIPSQALLGFLMGELYLSRKKLLKPSQWKTA
jgi:hypothetical protein